MKLFINDKNGYDELRIYEEEKVLIFVIIKTAKCNKKIVKQRSRMEC